MSEAEAAAGGGSGSGGAGGKEQDRYLPIANIGRIMRRAVPENGKIAKDAKESIQDCVSEFISFITSESVPPPVIPVIRSDLCLSLIESSVILISAERVTSA